MSVDNYIGMAKTPEGMRYSEKVTHAAGEAAGAWRRSQVIAKRLRERAVEYRDGEHPGGLWMSIELVKLAEEIEGT